jgi:hypothetical protein
MQRKLSAGAVLLVLAALALLAGCGGSDGNSKTSTSASKVTLGPALAMSDLPGILETPPPWGPNNAPDQLQLRLRALGLDPLTAEGQVVHIHQHLDLYVDGKKVTVPAQIGIAASGAFISDLHTHDDTGIMHVEAQKVQSFSLGQFFAVWGVRLGAKCIGSLCASGEKRLATWVNGTPVTADPTRIVLEEHQEIVLAYGAPAQDPDPVPKTYDFEKAGL